MSNMLENGILLMREEKETEPETLYLCENCGQDIRQGDDYYEIGGCKYCDDCVRYKTAEY